MFQVRILNADLSYDIKRLTRLSNFSTNFASSLIPVGRRISSSHRHSSVVTGLHIYTANNNVDADPVKYRIEGRGMMAGANIETRHSENVWCWTHIQTCTEFHLPGIVLVMTVINGST